MINHPRGTPPDSQRARLRQLITQTTAQAQRARLHPATPTTLRLATPPPPQPPLLQRPRACALHQRTHLAHNPHPIAPLGNIGLPMVPSTDPTTTASVPCIRTIARAHHARAPSSGAITTRTGSSLAPTPAAIASHASSTRSSVAAGPVRLASARSLWWMCDEWRVAGHDRGNGRSGRWLCDCVSPRARFATCSSTAAVRTRVVGRPLSTATKKIVIKKQIAL